MQASSAHGLYDGLRAGLRNGLYDAGLLAELGRVLPDDLLQRRRPLLDGLLRSGSAEPCSDIHHKLLPVLLQIERSSHH